jgi:hypothetical protein
VERRVHLIGSYPADTPEDAMREVLKRAGPHLAYLPDGETGARRNWIASIIDGLRGHPDLQVCRDGGWSDYRDPLNFKVRRGHRLDGASLDFGYVAAYEMAQQQFQALRTEFDRDDLAFQVGIPGDLDMAMFTLGPTGPFTHRRPFTDAVVRQITEIHQLGGDGVLVQLEAPAEQVFVTMAPAPLRPGIARWAGSGIAELARRSPVGTRFGVHLCLGDLGHKSLTGLSNAQPLVVMANALARRWPSDRTLEFVHAPLAAGADPPPLDPAFYAPLHGLRLPQRTRFVAGFLHEARSADEHKTILAAIENAVGAPVDVAASCGLGRRSREAAEHTLARGAELCEA